MFKSVNQIKLHVFTLQLYIFILKLIIAVTKFEVLCLKNLVKSFNHS